MRTQYRGIAWVVRKGHGKEERNISLDKAGIRIGEVKGRWRRCDDHTPCAKLRVGGGHRGSRRSELKCRKPKRSAAKNGLQ